MANFNSELALAKNRTADVKSQISTLEGSIAKMQSALQSAQSIATKSGNNAILNSSEYKNVNDQLQITKQYLEQVKNTGKTISLEALNKSVTSATNAVGQLNNKTKETQSGFKSVENALASMQVKLNNMKSTKLMDEGVINRLQTGLNNLATCTDKNSSAFKSYINEFNKPKEYDGINSLYITLIRLIWIGASVSEKAFFKSPASSLASFGESFLPLISVYSKEMRRPVFLK